MQFAVKEVSLSDVPEPKAFGVQPTKRSIWAEELLDAFIDSDAGIWEISADEEGRAFPTSKYTSNIANSFASKIKSKARFGGLNIAIRGKRLFVSKVKIMNGGKR